SPKHLRHLLQLTCVHVGIPPLPPQGPTRETMRASSEILAQESTPMHTLVRYRHPGGNAREQNSPVSLVESVWITCDGGHEWPAYRRDRYESLEVVLKHQADAMASG